MLNIYHLLSSSFLKYRGRAFWLNHGHRCGLVFPSYEWHSPWMMITSMYSLSDYWAGGVILITYWVSATAIYRAHDIELSSNIKQIKTYPQSVIHLNEMFNTNIHESVRAKKINKHTNLSGQESVG